MIVLCKVGFFVKKLTRLAGRKTGGGGEKRRKIAGW
jgi:hypothetical protein